ncbi:partial tRNA threonylcarbamoyladenosine biosynthesis protein TsaB, partial [Patescibacteria group bacterium]
ERTDTSIAYTAMDARMAEIFWGVYQRDSENLAQLIGEESVTPIATLHCATQQTGVGIGSAWRMYAAELSERLAGQLEHYETDNLPRAGFIARLGVADFKKGLAVPVEQAMPVYLRDKVAQTEAERGVA